MSQEKPAERVSASAPRRYKAAPLIATITVVVLVIACAAEGYLIYLKQLQIVSGSMDSEVIKGELTKLQTNLEQANRSVTRYGDLVGYYDLGELEEKVRDAQPPSARGYITKLETDLQVMATKLDGLQRERDTLKKDRDKAFAEKTAAETTFREELGKADQQVRQLEQDLKNEKAAHTTAVEDLQAQVTEWKGKYEKSKSDYEEVRLRHDLEQAKRQKLETRVEMLRVLLAQRLGVATPTGLSAVPLFPHQLRVEVVSAMSGAENYVTLAPHRKLEEGMRFYIYSAGGQPKCLIEVKNVYPDRVLADVIQALSEEPAKAGDIADLDLAYEEIRRPGGLQVAE